MALQEKAQKGKKEKEGKGKKEKEGKGKIEGKTSQKTGKKVSLPAVKSANENRTKVQPFQPCVGRGY